MTHEWSNECFDFTIYVFYLLFFYLPFITFRVNKKSLDFNNKGNF